MEKGDWYRESENGPQCPPFPRIPAFSRHVSEGKLNITQFQLRNAADGIYDASTCFGSRLLLAGLLGRNLLPSVCFHFSLLFLWVLEIEPRTWWVLGKCSIPGLHPQPFDLPASLVTDPLSIAAATAAPAAAG